MQRDGKWLDNFQVKANIRNLLILLAPVPPAHVRRRQLLRDAALSLLARLLAQPTRLSHSVSGSLFFGVPFVFVKGFKEGFDAHWEVWSIFILWLQFVLLSFYFTIS